MMCAAAAECPTTASVFIALRRDESLAPKGIIKGPAGEIGEVMINVIGHQRWGPRSKA